MRLFTSIRPYSHTSIRFFLLCLITAGGHSQPSVIQSALKEFWEPFKLSPVVYAKGEVTTFALAQNRATVTVQIDKGWGYTRLSLSGRQQESWNTPNGSYYYAEGVMRREGILERHSSEQENLEARLFAQMRQRIDEVIETGQNHLLDGSNARSWSVRVGYNGQNYWIDVYLHPLRNRLLGYSLWAKHPLRTDRVVRTVLFADYRTLKDRSVPFVKREYYDHVLFGETRWTNIQFTRKLDPRRLLEEARKRRTYYGRLPVTVSLKTRNVLTLVEVELRGDTGSIRAQMLLDTGASTTILTPETTRRLGLKISGSVGARPIGTELRLQSARLNSLKLGKVLIPNRWIATGDLGILSTLLNIDGILGSDVLSLFRFTLDFQRKQLILEPVGNGGIRERESRGKSQPAIGKTLPLDNLLGNPALRVWTPHQRSSWLILDTGAHFTVLPNALISDGMRQAGIRLTSALGPGGVSVALQGTRLPYLSLHDPTKGLKVTSTAVMFSADPHVNILPGTDIGVIGMNILRRYRVTFDYGRGQVSFVVNQYAGDQGAHIGVLLNMAQETAEVQSVVPLSPAQAAGLRRGDRLLRINGRSTSGVAPSEVQKWLRGPEGSSVKLHLLRGDEHLEVELKRETLLL